MGVTGLAFPSAPFADAQVSAGEVRVLVGVDADGNRHVLVLAGIRPKPWTAFARAKRRGNGEPYASWLASTRDALLAALGTQTRPLYSRDAVLGLAMSFGAVPAKHGGEKRATSVRTWDLRNLEKSFEDACKGILWADDKQVRFAGPGAAIDTTQDFCCAHVWQGGPWKAEWAAFTVPPVEG